MPACRPPQFVAPFTPDRVYVSVELRRTPWPSRTPPPLHAPRDGMGTVLTARHSRREIIAVHRRGLTPVQFLAPEASPHLCALARPIRSSFPRSQTPHPPFLPHCRPPNHRHPPPRFAVTAPPLAAPALQLFRNLLTHLWCSAATAFIVRSAVASRSSPRPIGPPP
jgi:hypothetical protein